MDRDKVTVLTKVEEKLGIPVAHASKDDTLVEFCREILSELLGTEWALVARVPGSVTSPQDLCIWDFASGETAIPEDLRPAKLPRNWFVIRRKDLTALRAVVGATDLHALLKPIPQDALRALLGWVAPNCTERKHDSGELVEALRVQRDEMLQFLILANLRLQENSQERNNFLVRSVHDFRAPLTAISGYLTLLSEEEFGPLTPEQQRVLGRLLHCATRLARISNAMLQLSAPHNVDQRLNLEKADIRNCLDQALHEVALVIEDKRISIATEVEPAPDGLLFETSLVEQTLVNLLDHACRFTPRDGKIEIRGYPFFWDRRAPQTALLDRALERRVGQVKGFNSFRVDVSDPGPGIPAEHIDRIFEEYTSYGGGLDRSGGGIGLAICRMILHRHQGRIWAESNPSGAVFSFVLPLQQMLAHDGEVEDASGAAWLARSVEE
jgi:signal transduction histidine kinase